jgi:two-component system, chemotaxis family, sensor histidine kinase and response regulator WspE
VNPPNPDFAAGLSLLELFRAEAEAQTTLLTNGLLELERHPGEPQTYDSLMRAAHSLKGAARIINLPEAVRLAHAFEDCFVAASRGQIILGQPEIDLVLPGVDLLAQLAKKSELELSSWGEDNRGSIEAFLRSLGALRQPGGPRPPNLPPGSASYGLEGLRESLLAEGRLGSMGKRPDQTAPLMEPPHALAMAKDEPAERVLRLGAGNLNRLLALAGESLVESRWLRPFADSLQQIKRHHTSLARQLERLALSLPGGAVDDRVRALLNEMPREVAQAEQFLANRLQELDQFDRRSAHLSQRLYLEVIRTRMRPFSEGVRRFPRMVRDLARGLGKQVSFEILGENTQVDRDILERLETPLAHLLRNAVDHGCESPPTRKAAGKPATCMLRLEARHSAGVLLVTVWEDGAGVDLEAIRRGITRKGLVEPNRARTLSEPELLEFLFLPGFTLKDTVTEISGRGFGLDVVQNMIKSVRGAIRLTNQPGKGLRVQLQLPLTLSVLRALLVEVGGEAYAVPLNRINRLLKLPRATVGVIEGRHTFALGDQQVSLLSAAQALDCSAPKISGSELSVVVLGDRSARYGLMVDRFLGERELVVQPLDPRLGKVQDISAAALMENGEPVLILDVDELVRSIDNLASQGRLARLQAPGLLSAGKRPKRILAVDDSLTVRELERKLLTSRGYLTEVAVDGAEAWDAVRSGEYDLVITDVDMPRLDGIQLATLIKKDSLLKSLPVLIVSYKDRPEDRMRGLEAGADYYLTKGSFQDEVLMQAVVDLIGEPEI